MGDRYGSRGGDSRPGDWICYQCDTNNFARRDQCFKCQADKPDGDGYGDEGYRGGGGGYGGGYGGRRGGYGGGGGGGGYRGGYDDGYGDDYGHRRMRNRSRSPPRFGGRDRGGDIRDGDWECYKCGTNNFARRDKCFKCSHSRGGGGGGMRGGMRGRGGRGGGGGGDDNWREGDWSCNSCQQHNFARRDQCYKCGEPK